MTLWDRRNWIFFCSTKGWLWSAINSLTIHLFICLLNLIRNVASQPTLVTTLGYSFRFSFSKHNLYRYTSFEQTHLRDTIFWFLSCFTSFFLTLNLVTLAYELQNFSTSYIKLNSIFHTPSVVKPFKIFSKTSMGSSSNSAFSLRNQSFHHSNWWRILFLCLCSSYPWRNLNIKERVLVRKLHHLAILVINLVLEQQINIFISFHTLFQMFHIISQILSYIFSHFCFIINIWIIFYNP